MQGHNFVKVRKIVHCSECGGFVSDRMIDLSLIEFEKMALADPANVYVTELTKDDIHRYWYDDHYICEDCPLPDDIDPDSEHST